MVAWQGGDLLIEGRKVHYYREGTRGKPPGEKNEKNESHQNQANEQIKQPPDEYQNPPDKQQQ